MSWVAERVQEVLSDWFTQMSQKYCGKDYGSERRNQYFVYRTVYKMTASQALHEVNKSREVM